MHRKFNTFLLSAVIIAVVFSGCDQKRRAIGNEDEIFVIADSAEYYELEGDLLQVFGKTIFTPQPENLFELIPKPLNELNKLKRRKNIIIIAPLDSDSDVSKYIKSLADSTVETLIRNGKEYVINKYNMWAADQLVMILSAPTIKDLRMNILRDQDNLVYYFQKISNERLFKTLYARKYERKEIQGRLLKDFGWMMYVQIDFLLASADKEDNFVWLRRAPGSDMERWIFVHWIENASPELLNKDSIVSIRNKLTKRNYLTRDKSSYVEISENYLKTSEINFLGRYAIMTQGLWRMADMSMGGPFINYTFYDDSTKRLYMLDGSLYAPKYYKKKLIQQVDILLQSFKTIGELSEDRIEELVDAADENPAKY